MKFFLLWGFSKKSLARLVVDKIGIAKKCSLVCIEKNVKVEM